jgi:hypothetical protein
MARDYKDEYNKFQSSSVQKINSRVLQFKRREELTGINIVEELLELVAYTKVIVNT